ncbi:MAG: hypothetical protein GVY04_00860 [Cyanobacteria bacterium]|jgi:hypothetical protein|nr:hypothetical protein [Cyanobacteria bacterium GSL.Bin1]
MNKIYYTATIHSQIADPTYNALVSAITFCQNGMGCSDTETGIQEIQKLWKSKNSILTKMEVFNKEDLVRNWDFIREIQFWHYSSDQHTLMMRGTDFDNQDSFPALIFQVNNKIVMNDDYTLWVRMDTTNGDALLYLPEESDEIN